MIPETDSGYLQRLAELEARVDQARLSPEILSERAAGLLAGRIGCRIDEAHAHLRLLAGQQNTSVASVAATVIGALEIRRSTSLRQVRHSVEEALRATDQEPDQPVRVSAPDASYSWLDVVQQMLNALPGKHIVVVPVRGDDGRITDYECVAVSPGMRDLSGRTGPQLIGMAISTAYPDIVGGPVWRAWADSLTDGHPRSVEPFTYVHIDNGDASEHLLTVRVRPVGPGLLNSWVMHDEQTRLAERIDQTERLGNLGYGEWDLITDTTVWSDGLYRIYERDPADGPLPRAESEALGLPEDEPLRRQAAEEFGRGETIDLTTRALINGKVKHLRAVIDTVRDAEGRPRKVYGIIQDVTARETSRRKLAEVERQLHEHQQDLAAEHRLAAQLQHIVLPIPETPVDLPGLRAAVRYLPAEQASRIGGDWFHAALAGDGSVVLAVGDVAGHGVQAAATMAQLRHTMAALTMTTTSQPAELLAHLNRLLLALGVSTAPATAVIVRWEPATHACTWSQAGHPPPLHARAGVAVELPRPAGPLLGGLAHAEYGTNSLDLAAGDILLLYTDGLVEHRERTLSEGTAPVADLMSRVTAERRDYPLDVLLAGLQRANPDDDTCLLAVRRTDCGNGHD
ncbi:hypothetical protein Ade02nite_08960 [Paractinoplanes deccanensis]|uniref:ANTAR domain-containing protein n=1 Tax=Paractinoplanes deccanensis TaxID=113561 RepID=A0ABQ3XX77_9ACTN|nr:SpoIIE family protein phosphatase [Actinoplanes deccanensis]GID72255.1 hypothetical protein Ade02nite_08960 [Actinoplanes deccanensis]